MNKLAQFYNSLYFTKRFYFIGAVIVLLFAASFFLFGFFKIAQLGLLFLLAVVILDITLLYFKRRALLAGRIVSKRFSNGDDNLVTLQLYSNYNFPLKLIVIDELPIQFQQPNWHRNIQLAPNQKALLEYNLKPLKRGEYVFNNILALATSPLNIVQRKFIFPAKETVLVYPSYIQMRKFNLLGVSNSLTEAGSKRLRKLGNSVEFEQIKEYVQGDDYRTINWKASARKNQLMVNTYVDEKSQQVYCLIDKSRNMKMPFDGLTLLDYAINASLVLTNVALQKQDKAGLITFAERLDNFLVADKKSMQMEAALETLYKQDTKFLDADYENLYAHIRNKIKQRSLLVLFTNFESQYALQRQMPYLKQIAHHHLLLVVFFENTGIKTLAQQVAKDTEEIYIQTIAEKFLYEKKWMIKELQKNGIIAVLSTPQNLTVSAINKYLEIKLRQMV